MIEANVGKGSLRFGELKHQAARELRIASRLALGWRSLLSSCLRRQLGDRTVPQVAGTQTGSGLTLPLPTPAFRDPQSGTAPSRDFGAHGRRRRIGLKRAVFSFDHCFPHEAHEYLRDRVDS